ncbi:hypothetical protein AMET1_0118 [Methanonatronarchaeum thermophilum]|uniref:Uncharacterized protein n=1 Tax=Methanonatronarchaeum thermophilum TaxID=1927129 RepID=A0A1Y3GDD1_9EURY|nr:hypothetical protein [Methanonatronarchaeum thermophilum]OUJ19448.1 hypothetical protein AMET1_0118 [Methanonatronarchaeum thermophilum]
MKDNDMIRKIGVPLILLSIITLLLGGTRIYEGILVTIGINLAILIAIIGVIAMFYGIIKASKKPE